jgi:MFS family permease
MEVAPAETVLPQDIQSIISSEPPLPLVPQAEPNVAKNAIRRSLRASTWDGVFATVFSNVAGGVLLSNFLVELGASAIEIGMLASIPMVANLLQPIGAYMADRSNSRHWYCLWIYGPSRLLWLVLLGAIAIAPWSHFTSPQLVQLTLAIVLASHFLGALGSASWLSWLAALVPRRLRGRYFGIRNSAASLTNLICVPLLGFVVSKWQGGSFQGYGVVLALGIATGLISLVFQCFMVDVNPQVQQAEFAKSSVDAEVIPELRSAPSNAEKPQPLSNPLEVPEAETQTDIQPYAEPHDGWWRDFNFLRFLLYFGVWMFAVNLSAPFFNLYLLDDLALDVSWVTIYNSLSAGANLLMLLWWGRIADRIGNRPILILVGVLVAVTPILWLGTSANTLSLWVWLPLLHMLGGGTWAAIDLCSSNMQLGVAPIRHQASYFAIAAAIAGVSGALGTTTGGFLAQFSDYGGLPGLFALSSVLRLVALLPLIFVHEQRGQSLREMTRILFSNRALAGTEEPNSL